MKLYNCPICSINVPVKEHLLPSSIEKDKFYTYLYFPCCDFYKQNPLLSKEQMNTLYEKDYAVFNQKGMLKLLMKRITKRRVRNFGNLIKNKDILEIGSGTGEFLHYCKPFDPKSIEGVETSEFAVTIAKQNYNVNISCSTFENFKTEKKYDVIFMFHVIEHFNDPQFIIDKCKNLLNKSGRLIMETPNSASYESKFYSEYWPNWSVPFHIFIFSPKSLSGISLRCGLKVNAIHYSAFSNTYSKLIPFLIKHKNPLLIPFFVTKFLIKTIISPLYKQSGTMTIEVEK